MIKKVLIANRGEIALRILRACKELGLKTVMVYSQADSESMAVHLADEKVCIGPAPAAESYLNIPRLISAAEITDADAIHPGYGFLAENASFAEICESCKITWIGPSPEAIAKMGDKAEARTSMNELGIPITPGSDGPVENHKEAISFANKLGYPVILKASGGGGGRGMRIAHTEISLAQAFLMAQQEADMAFGNPEIYLEKYLEKPRHIEIQILGDKHGNIIHLGERDCSLQRRHQKILEEAPSPALNEDVRQKMGEMAVKAAKSVDYVGAGTVEFLLDSTNNFYFMEMNTRIQVEHPVTEMVTGVDLVKLQILAAGGEPLPIKQSDIKINGHCIECRINAEDPEENFRPAPGKINFINLPGGPGVRVDTHIYQGYFIPPIYDSLIAKLLTHGSTRDEAISRMMRALSEFIIEGTHTTIPFHLEILQNSKFQEGDTHTHFIQDYLSHRYGGSVKEAS